jgi:hypothetical protein
MANILKFKYDFQEMLEELSDMGIKRLFADVVNEGMKRGFKLDLRFEV